MLVTYASESNTLGDNEDWSLFVNGATRGTIVPVAWPKDWVKFLEFAECHPRN